FQQLRFNSLGRTRFLRPGAEGIADEMGWNDDFQPSSTYSPMVQGSSSFKAAIFSPRLLISFMSSVAIASWIVVLIFLTVEKAILHAIGFELVAFTTRVMPCRSKITSAPA